MTEKKELAFVPRRVYFEPEALEYPLGQRLYEHFRETEIPVLMTTSHNRVTGIPGSTATEAYLEAKATVVVGVKRGLDFATCKPSAHYQLPLATSCPGKCEYCYLATTLGKKPYLRVYVNIDQILDRAAEYIRKRLPEVTVFEGAATSDPLSVEPLTGSLARTIAFFGKQSHGRFRFATKQTGVTGLLGLEHQGHTRVRFSLNCRRVIKQYEHGVPGLDERLEALRRLADAGYPVGVIIAPVFVFPGWEDEYRDLLDRIEEYLGRRSDLTFELISHRFTLRARERIREVFPRTGLPLEQEGRMFKFGQFGYGKYLYSRETREQLQSVLTGAISDRFPESRIEYFV